MAGIIISLLMRCAMGALAMRIAELRGEERGFAWGFWLGTIGLFVVAFRKPQMEQGFPQSEGIRWMCLKCGAHNPSGTSQCQSCRTPRSYREPKRTCKSCGASNNAANDACFACGKPLA